MDLPACRNKNCPKLGTNLEVILLGEGDDHWLFGCKCCKGIEYRTKPSGWKRASQERGYQRLGRPEYARTRAFFGLGKNRV